MCYAIWELIVVIKIGIKRTCNHLGQITRVGGVIWQIYAFETTVPFEFIVIQENLTLWKDRNMSISSMVFSQQPSCHAQKRKPQLHSISFLWLLHSFCPLFYDVPWALEEVTCPWLLFEHWVVMPPQLSLILSFKLWIFPSGTITHCKSSSTTESDSTITLWASAQVLKDSLTSASQPLNKTVAVDSTLEYLQLWGFSLGYTTRHEFRHIEQALNTTRRLFVLPLTAYTTTAPAVTSCLMFG